MIFFTNKKGEIVTMSESERLEYLKGFVEETSEQILAKNIYLFPEEIDFFCESLKIELECLLGGERYEV